MSKGSMRRWMLALTMSVTLIVRVLLNQLHFLAS